MAARKKPVAHKAPPDTKTQKERFIEAARKAEASEDPNEFDRAFGRIINRKPSVRKSAGRESA